MKDPRTRYTVSAKRSAAFETEAEAEAVAARILNGEVLYSKRHGGFIVWSHRFLKWVAEASQ